jgi:hypothetical protein
MSICFYNKELVYMSFSGKFYGLFLSKERFIFCMGVDYYEILEIERKASDNEIKKA